MSGSSPPSPVNCTPSNWACSTRRATSAFIASGTGDSAGTASAFTITRFSAFREPSLPVREPIYTNHLTPPIAALDQAGPQPGCAAQRIRRAQALSGAKPVGMQQPGQHPRAQPVGLGMLGVVIP